MEAGGGNLWGVTRYVRADARCPAPRAMPLITRPWSTRGLPLVSVGRAIRANCLSVSQK